MHGLLQDLGITFFVATVVGYVVERIKQPAIIAYLIGGVINRPEIGPQLVTNIENIETISEIGLILLLFILGLEMQPTHLITILRKVYLAGVGQFIPPFLACYSFQVSVMRSIAQTLKPCTSRWRAA